MPQYFDLHSHLNFKDYDQDWDAVIARLRETGTHTIVVGTDYQSSKRAVELAGEYPEIYACIGVHPVDDPSRAFEVKDFAELVTHPKVVAVGECGLDFFHADRVSDFERQKNLFLAQVDFAIQYDKPLMIHARAAYPELLTLLDDLKQTHGPKLRGNVHFFAGTWEEAQRFFALGFTISFTGVITFANQYDEVVRKAPLEMIHAETDAPYVAPKPYRGGRNEPSYVQEVYKRIAELRGEDPEMVRQALVQNALGVVGY
jgi:TatD DNase family protein